MKKFAIITGGSGSLGYKVVASFLKEDYVVHAFLNPWGNEELPISSNLTSEKVDLTNESEVNDSLEKVFENKGTPDVVVMCAGGFAMDNMEDIDLEKLNKMFNQNFVTAFNVAKKCYDKMKDKNPGKIFMIGARQGINADTALSSISYGLAKSLLFHFSNILNEAGKSHNIQSHIIVPSIINTPANRDAMPGANFNEWIETTDIIETIHFLLSKTGMKVRQNEIRLYNNT